MLKKGNEESLQDFEYADDLFLSIFHMVNPAVFVLVGKKLKDNKKPL